MIQIRNPIGGGTIPGDPRWAREGETFDTLTLRPSIDVGGAHQWHGFITAGEVKPA